MNESNINRWIENFNDKDKVIAQKLFNSLQFFNLDHIQKELYKVLDFTNSKINYALYPIMDIKIQKQNKEQENYLDLIKDRNLLFTTETGKQFNDADSEYVFMHLIRNFCSSKKNLHTMPLRADYKNKKIRELILLTDVIATGQQVEDYLKYLIKDKTIKSYISLNLITKIHVVCHMATYPAIERIKKTKIFSKKNIIDIKYTRIARTVDNYFPEVEKQQIISLCQEYTTNRNPLGYGNVGLLSIYTHRSSNNVPAILNQYKKKWSGVIEDRQTKEEYIKENINESCFNLENIFLIIKENNKAIAHRLSIRLGISILHARFIVTNLIEAKYITSKGYMTEEGRKLYKKLFTSNTYDNIKEIDSYVEKVYYPYYKKGHST